jgi:spermidine synthase
VAKRKLYFEIFTVSLVAILLEISYTRIFSFKVYYYFTYLIIGIALMGLGSGGVLVAVSKRLRQADPGQLISKLCIGGGGSVVVGYLIIAPTQLNVSMLTYGTGEILKLVGVCLLLMVPFLAIGIILSTILSSNPEAASRLYAADLLGAALGCVICIPILVTLDPPRTVILAGLIFTLAGIRLAIRSIPLLGAAGVTSLALLLPLVSGGMLPDPVVDKIKDLDLFRASGDVQFSKWHPVFRVDVSKSFSEPGNYLLHHDGLLGSGLYRFDGDFSSIDYLSKDCRSLPFEVLPREPRVLVIGAAGGNDVLAALFFGARHVTGVELNPVTLSLLTDTYADVTGRLHENPRVTLVHGEGRWFLKQAEEQYDLIWLVSPDSYAAMNASSAGAFVLSESYLYTVEMLKESLKHLTDQGILCVQFGEIYYDRKPNRTTRYLATARQAFAELGVPAFEQHVAFSTTAGLGDLLHSTILIGKSPFDPAQVKRFVQKTMRIANGKVRYVPGQQGDGSPTNNAITLPEPQLSEWLKEYPYLVDAVRDNSPFFWHFTRFRDALTVPVRVYGRIRDYEDTIGERVSFILLILAAVFASFFLLLPFVKIREIWTRIPRKISTGVYFASLGLGFMCLEVSLIQMLTLFLGYPTYSLTVTLFAILVFSGVGSALSENYTARRNRALGILLGVLLGLVLLYQFGLPAIVDRFIGYSLGFRVGLTMALIAPLGLCLGAFMPLGLMTIAAMTDHPREYVAWGWAVNGFFSVIASILSTILAMTIGFRLLLSMAFAIYVVGALMLSRIPQSGEDRH